MFRAIKQWLAYRHAIKADQLDNAVEIKKFLQGKYGWDYRFKH